MEALGKILTDQLISFVNYIIIYQNIKVLQDVDIEIFISVKKLYRLKNLCSLWLTFIKAALPQKAKF